MRDLSALCSRSPPPSSPSALGQELCLFRTYEFPGPCSGRSTERAVQSFDVRKVEGMAWGAEEWRLTQYNLMQRRHISLVRTLKHREAK